MPQHPYTIGLLGAIPRLDLEQTRLVSIDGQVPSPTQALSGCSFAPRCPFAQPICEEQVPVLQQVGDAHFSACVRAPLEAEHLVSDAIGEVTP
jgi:oligopeptide/dipeptide ABC transporter ATP-binding protein